MIETPNNKMNEFVDTLEKLIKEDNNKKNISAISLLTLLKNEMTPDSEIKKRESEIRDRFENTYIKIKDTTGSGCEREDSFSVYKIENYVGIQREFRNNNKPEYLFNYSGVRFHSEGTYFETVLSKPLPYLYDTSEKISAEEYDKCLSTHKNVIRIVKGMINDYGKS